MNNDFKFSKALTNLYNPIPEYTYEGHMDSETVFNSTKWKTGEDENGNAIFSDTPPSGITWTAVKAEMDNL